MSSFTFSCQEYHSSCSEIWIRKFLVMAKYTLKMYGTLHLLTTILFNRKELRQKFGNTIIKLMIKILKSAAFMTGFVVLMRISQCILPRLTGTYSIYYSIAQTMISSTTILFESSERVVDYIIFTLPRTLDGLADLLVKLGYIKSIPKLPQILLSIAVGLGVYLDNMNGLKPGLKRGIDFLIN